jgi:hypothetical protein
MHNKARQVDVPTRCAAHTRYPIPESVLNDAIVQPYIHDYLVHIREGTHIYRYRIFFKRHCRLPVNFSMAPTPHIFRGDALVMRVGACDCHPVMNMRDRDTILSDFAIIKYVF